MVSPDVLERTRPRSMGRRALLILALATLLLGVVVGGPTSAAVEEGLAVSVVPFAEGLEQPTFVTSGRDGSGRLYALEKPGRVRVIEADGTLLDEPLLDISERVLMSFEQGLLGLAFHPDFKRNGRFFVNYTAQPDGATVVSEFRVVDGRVDPAAERMLLVVPQPEPIHNGGMIAFDASGQLLVGMGDGGPGGDLSDNAQDPSSLLGKIIAIDVDIEASVGPSPAIIASGLRNPWRFSLDRENGDIYIGDVGQAHWEEIDVVPAGVTGLNFGWPLLEGPQCGFSHRFCDVAAFQAPALAYPHLDGAAVIGGYVYRGSAQPELEGLYLFADWLSGTIWAADSEQMQAGAADPTRVGSLGARGVLTSFGEDEAGELYVVDTRGSILRLVAAGG